MDWMSAYRIVTAEKHGTVESRFHDHSEANVNQNDHVRNSGREPLSTPTLSRLFFRDGFYADCIRNTIDGENLSLARLSNESMVALNNSRGSSYTLSDGTVVTTLPITVQLADKSQLYGTFATLPFGKLLSLHDKSYLMTHDSKGRIDEVVASETEEATYADLNICDVFIAQLFGVFHFFAHFPNGCV